MGSDGILVLRKASGNPPVLIVRPCFDAASREMYTGITTGNIADRWIALARLRVSRKPQSYRYGVLKYAERGITTRVGWSTSLTGVTNR